jgi:hypothetical protein
VCPLVLEYHQCLEARTYLWGHDRFEDHTEDEKHYITLNLTQVPVPRLNPRGVKSLLVREAYSHAYNTMIKNASHNRSMFLVIGHPGIGGFNCQLESVS